MKPVLEMNLTDSSSPCNDSYPEKTKETLGQMAVADPRNALLFTKYGLDYSFDGAYTLKQACDEKKISLMHIEHELNVIRQQPRVYGIRYSDWTSDYLADFICTNHHSYVRKSLLLLTEEFNQVSIAVQLKYPFIALISEVFQHVAMDMSAYLVEEEQVLFPYIRFLVQAKKSNLPVNCLPEGCLEHHMTILHIQQRIVGENMEFIRRLSNNYTVPEDESSSCTLLFQWLNDFDNDLQQHVHLENNILFPNAVKLEKECLRKSNQLHLRAPHLHVFTGPLENLL